MLLKTKILVGLGVGAAGVGAIALGRKLYLDSLSDDDHRAVNMVGDSFGSTNAPTAQAVALAYQRAAKQVAAMAPGAGSGGTSMVLAISQASSPGTLKVKIQKPECEIVYDEDHYAGTGLAARFDSGEILSWSKGNAIMQWSAWDGPEVKGQTAAGEDYNLVKVTGGFYIKRLASDEFTAEHKKLGYHLPLPEVWAWDKKYNKLYGGSKPWGQVIPPKPKAVDILGYVQGKANGAAKSNAENYLLSEGYQFVKASQGDTTQLDLSPGWYQVVARPVWRANDRSWRYLQGYWKWTNDGPRAKSSSSQWKKFKDGGCTNKLTEFYRLVEQDRWGDISSLAHVASGKSTSVKVTPLVTLAITDRATKKNSYSRGFNAVCTGYKVGEKIFKKSMGIQGAVIWWLVEKFFGKVIQVHS